MNKIDILKFTGSKSTSIVEAMTKIDINEKGILFIVDESNKLMGCITDGDIRRWLIKTGDLNVPVEYAMNTTPKFVEQSNSEKAEILFAEMKITALPVTVDEKIVDILFAEHALELSRRKHKKDNT